MIARQLFAEESAERKIVVSARMPIQSDGETM